ncbi:MAG TPA: heme-binding protein [Pseudogracilibacillus sp.]|nr:heme-binding protein [Pseudogracilibacillus sp.]
MTFIEKKSLSYEAAQRLIKGAIKKAEELNIAVNIAVVDDGGHLISFARMDGAALLSVDIAKNKAYTSAAFGIPTHEWFDLIKDHDALRTGIVHTDRLVVFGGGYPVYSDDKLAGAIGISGGSEEEDMLCCQAALKQL